MCRAAARPRRPPPSRSCHPVLCPAAEADRAPSVPGPCEPEDLIDGIIFAANYLGSTQLLSERNPSKNIRMMQAQEAVSRVKVGAGRGRGVVSVDPRPSEGKPEAPREAGVGFGLKQEGAGLGPRGCSLRSEELPWSPPPGQQDVGERMLGGVPAPHGTWGSSPGPTAWALSGGQGAARGKGDRRPGDRGLLELWVRPGFWPSPRRSWGRGVEARGAEDCGCYPPVG